MDREREHERLCGMLPGSALYQSGRTALARAQSHGPIRMQGKLGSVVVSVPRKNMRTFDEYGVLLLPCLLFGDPIILSSLISGKENLDTEMMNNLLKMCYFK